MDRGAWQATGPRGHERVRYGLASKQQKQKWRAGIYPGPASVPLLLRITSWVFPWGPPLPSVQSSGLNGTDSFHHFWGVCMWPQLTNPHALCPGGMIVPEMGVCLQPDQKRVSPPVSLESGDSTLFFSGVVRLIAHQPGSAGGYVTATWDEASLQESRGKRGGWDSCDIFWVAGFSGGLFQLAS